MLKVPRKGEDTGPPSEENVTGLERHCDKWPSGWALPGSGAPLMGYTIPLPKANGEMQHQNLITGQQGMQASRVAPLLQTELNGGGF